MVKFKFYFLFPYLLLDLIASPLTAQNNRRPLSSEDLFFAKGHNRFDLNVYLDNGNIQREFGLADLENRLGWGFSLTWLHTSQINQTWGVEWGIKVGALPWKYYYEITKGGVANFPFNDLNYGTE